MSPTCSLQLSAVSECPENHWKFEKKLSSGAPLKTHCMRNFPPSDCILIVAQIVSQQISTCKCNVLVLSFSFKIRLQIKMEGLCSRLQEVRYK